MLLFLFCLVLFINTEGAIIAIDDKDIPELKYLNKSVHPCDDFYEFSCGNFRNFHPRSGAKLAVSDNFELLENELLSLAREILTSPIRRDDPVAYRRAKQAFEACIDTDQLDSPELQYPELRIVKEVGGMPMLMKHRENVEFSWNDIGDMVANYGVPMFFNVDVVDLFGFGYSIYLDHDNGIQLPSFIRPKMSKNHDDFLEESFREFSRVERSTQVQPFDVLLETIVKRLRDVTNSSISDEVLMNDLEEVKSFMRQMYKGGDLTGLPKNDLPSAGSTLESLNNWTSTYFGDNYGLNWIEYMNHTFKMAEVYINENTTVIQNIEEIIYGTINLVKKTDPKVVKNYALIRIFLYLAEDSDAAMREAFETYYNSKKFNIYPRWKYCARKLLDVQGYASLSFAIAYEYQKYYFNVNKFSKAVALIRDIEQAYRETLNENQWMDSSSKAAALKKADNMLTLLAFPEFVENTTILNNFYENLRICSWDNYGNSQRLRAFKMAYSFSQIGRPKIRTFWNKSPFEVNAYYNRPNNRMMFPISMLNPVFFSGNISVLDYSRIGSVIGHEMTHGYDSEGRKYNYRGVYGPWWTSETLKNFEQKTQCFIDQYNKYKIEELNGIHVNGTNTLNENLADNGGIRSSFNALQRYSQRNNTVQRTKEYTYEQLFFIGFGTMWCSDASPAYIQSIRNYPPNKFRVNGAVSNMEEFSKAFNCPVNSNMNPEDKCRLW